MHRHACLVTQLFPTVCAPVDYSLPDCSVHGIFLARILEQVAVSSSRGSSLAGIKAEFPRSPALAGGFFTTGKIYSPILLGKYIIDCLLRTRCCSRKTLPSLLHPGQDSSPCESPPPGGPHPVSAARFVPTCPVFATAVSLSPATSSGSRGKEPWPLSLSSPSRSEEGTGKVSSTPHTECGPQGFPV